MVLCKSAAEEISFEWSHHEIFITNSLRAAVQTVCRYVCHNKDVITIFVHLGGAFSIQSSQYERLRKTSKHYIPSRRRRSQGNGKWGLCRETTIKNNFKPLWKLATPVFFSFFFSRQGKLWWSRKQPRLFYTFLGGFTWLATAVNYDQEEVILCSLEVKMS